MEEKHLSHLGLIKVGWCHYTKSRNKYCNKNVLEGDLDFKNHFLIFYEFKFLYYVIDLLSECHK